MTLVLYDVKLPVETASVRLILQAIAHVQMRQRTTGVLAYLITRE
jgi:hypothetical protein